VEGAAAQQDGADAETTPDPPDQPAEEPAVEAKAPAKTGKSSSKAKKDPPTKVKSPAIPDAPADGGGLKEGMKSFRKLKEPVLATLEIIRRAAPDKSSSYTLAREWVWAHVAEPPSSSGKTSVPSPGTRDRTNWDSMAARGDWVDLLHSAEGRWQKTVLWLDPHRYVFKALGELGLVEAQSAVHAAVAAFVEHLPGLLDLEFADGSPFADDETRGWIAKYSGGSSVRTGATASIALSSVSEGEASEGAEFMEEVEKLLEKNKFSEAVLGFESGLARVPSRRLRFRLKLRFAQQLLAADRVHVARPMLEALEEEVRRFDLENWEPSLSAPVLQALLVALGNSSGSDGTQADFAQAMNRLRVRLARLDAFSVLEPGN
jgi:type VI secretion system protein VasJ